MHDGVDWPQEQIPDRDDMFMRAHWMFFRARHLQPGVFRSHDGGMSADWDKYSSAEETRQRAKTPQDNAVISLSAGSIRNINTLNVQHTPEPTNRAHSDVTGFPEGEDFTEIRVLLLAASNIVIAL